MRLPRFPYEVRVAALDAKLTIRQSWYRKGRCRYRRFRFSHFIDGRRRRETFSDFGIARARAETLLTQLRNGQAAVAELTNEDAFTYLRAMEAREGYETPIDEIVREWVKSRKMLGPVTNADAAAFYVRQHRGVFRKTFSEVLIEFLSAKELAVQRGELSKTYQASLKDRCGRFEKEFGSLPFAELSKDLVRAFVSRQTELASKSKSNLIEALNTLCNFARGRSYLPKDFEAFQKEDILDARVKPIYRTSTYRPKELSALLSHAGEHEAFFLALGAFTGIRTAEFMRLQWEDLKFDADAGDGVIIIDAEKAKTRSRRVVPMLPNLKKWLPSDARNRTGRLWPHSQAYLYESLQAVCKRAGVKWKPNALRKSFISYRYMQIHNVERVAEEAGNSSRMIFDNYRDTVTEEEAKAWFSIEPGEGAQLVLFPTAVAKAS